MPDHVCQLRGIPEHLHQCDRGHADIPSGTLAYRRCRDEEIIDKNGNYDLSLGLRFESNRSSVNRSDLCQEPADVLYKTAEGGKYEKFHVLSFPIDSLKATEDSPILNEVNADKYIISVRHEPEQCNYAHCNLIVMKNDIEVAKIKPTTIKNRIRDLVKDHFKIEVKS